MVRPQSQRGVTMEAPRQATCPFCKGGISADVVQFGGNCPHCLLEIPGEEAPTDPGLVARQKAAAEAVGANPTICRVCSYFHDIGKILKPDYFTENIPHGHNPHDDLTPTMSSLIPMPDTS